MNIERNEICMQGLRTLFILSSLILSSQIVYILIVLIVSLILSGRVSELPKTFTLGIKLKLRKIQTEKLKMIVRVVIIKTC